MTLATDQPGAFDFKPLPEAARQVHRVVEEYLSGFAPARELSVHMGQQTGTRFADWIDTLFLSSRVSARADWEAVGFKVVDEDFYGAGSAGAAVLRHPAGVFPSIVIWDQATSAAAIKVESVVDFLCAQGLDDRVEIVGPATGRFRYAEAWADAGHGLWAIERHGYTGYRLAGSPDGATGADRPVDPAVVLRFAEAFALRRRAFESSEQGYAHVQGLIRQAVDALGVDHACDLFFAAERRYWQGRNRAAQIQKARQDRLGLGWANHDHHTYRSSRGCFSALIKTLEMLGFTRREKFYAGAEAGWGAQVMEQKRTGITVFADVDMSALEVTGDFSDGRLTDNDRLGTVGLWCALHGEAMLEAGMHHLECQFDFARVRDQLAGEFGVKMMKPFTDFAFLKQAFTEGQMWRVNPERLARLVRRGAITQAQAETFERDGALGSHLESLQRDDGFKGFNQTGINQIIAATDPRRGQRL